MYAISLSSIPPRFARIGPVLESLLAQRPAPERVILALPRRYVRFYGPVQAPALPAGVELMWSAQDHGPATKALVASDRLAGQVPRLIYCDDDWIAGPGWAAALLEAAHPDEAVTGQGFSVARLGRVSGAPTPEHADIAQGFSGVLIDPAWLSGPDLAPPTAVRAVDDIWLSGLLAARGIAIRSAPPAREALRPAFADDHALQDSLIAGQGRHDANLTAAALIHARHDIWPKAT
ncbi:MAG: hypothetical protein ACQEVT_16445 [Pseudomonadota bacterium]|uniref:hypothetical protein n=1 Tax=Roseovarius TaxID=74030 RepID=UPI0022A8AF4E|nr:hypothetical protein [Roseovarius sp. EGI FJ00037]MCZ0814035.1 hypothetical protein [Roseovarius sp. EGI FJ00037]